MKESVCKIQREQSIMIHIEKLSYDKKKICKVLYESEFC